MTELSPIIHSFLLVIQLAAPIALGKHNGWVSNDAYEYDARVLIYSNLQVSDHSNYLGFF